MDHSGIFKGERKLKIGMYFDTDKKNVRYFQLLKRGGEILCGTFRSYQGRKLKIDNILFRFFFCVLNQEKGPRGQKLILYN